MCRISSYHLRRSETEKPTDVKKGIITVAAPDVVRRLKIKLMRYKGQIQNLEKHTAKAEESIVAKETWKVLVLSEVTINDSVASVPQLDRSGQFVLCGDGRARIKDSEFNVLAEAPLGAENSYQFHVSDLARKVRV